MVLGKLKILFDKYIKIMYNNHYAGVAELADAPDLGSGVPDVQVQVLSPAPAGSPRGQKSLRKYCGDFLFCYFSLKIYFSI